MIFSSSFYQQFQMIKAIPVFSHLNWYDLQRIARRAQIDSYRKGDLISKEGDPPDYLYCLSSGRLRSYVLSEAGVKENVEFIHRGHCFGIISLLTNKNHSMNFEVLNDSVVIKFPVAIFRQLLKTIPQLSIDFSEILSKRARQKVKGAATSGTSTVVSVYSPIQSTGSSTYAMHLALSLAKQTKKKTLFIHIHSKEAFVDQEGKPSSEQRTVLWKRPAVDFKEIAMSTDNLDRYVLKNDDGIDMIDIIFESTEVIVDSATVSLSEYIAPFISNFVDDYHYIVVGLPNEMDNLVLEALTQSDLVHLISLDKDDDLQHTRRVIDQLQDRLQQRFRQDKIRVLIRADRDKHYLSFEEVHRKIDYPIYLMLPFIYDDDVETNQENLYVIYSKVREKSAYDKVVTRIAREVGDRLVGLVLGGGAAYGLSHIGVLHLLEREGIEIDMVVGSSMGALIGSLWSIGYDAQELDSISRDFEKMQNVFKLADVVFPISGFIGGRSIVKWLRKYLGNRSFYSTEMPLKIVAYDLARREELVIDSGSLVDAVRQSISIPGVMEPVRKKDRLIIDGGVLNPLPTNVLAGLGVSKIIAVNVLQSPQDVAQSLDIYERKMKEKEQVSFWRSPFFFIRFRLVRFFSKMFRPNISDIIMMTLMATEYEISEKSAQSADVTIHPDLSGLYWFEIYKADELIKRGEKAALAQLDAIKELLKH